MGFKSFVILLLAACAVQCITALPSQETLKQPRDLQEDLKNLIDELAALAEKTFEDLAKLFQSIQDKLQAEGKKVADLLAKNFQRAVQKIDELVAAAGGKDISTCTDPNLKEITAIHFNALISADECHEEAGVNSNYILAQAKANMPDVAGEAKRLLDEFFACTNIICRTEVLGKATIKNTEMTIRIGAVAAKASLDLTDSGIRGGLCMNSAVTSANVKIVEILADIVECVKDLQ